MSVLPSNVTTWERTAPIPPTAPAPSPRPGRPPGFFSTPKGQVLVVFAVLLAIAAPGEGIPTVLPHLLAAIVTACLVELPFLYRQTHRLSVPTSALLTGLVVAFVLDPRSGWVVAAWTSGFAILAKWLIRSERDHVFNPAALALVWTAVVFDSGQSWWGALGNVSGWWVPVLLVAGAFITERLNKWPLALAFLGGYFGLFTLDSLVNAQAVAEMFRDPFVQAALFLAFFMLTDPPTSPNRLGEQVAFGVLAAAVAVAAQLGGLGQIYLLVGVLAANAALFAYRGWTRSRVARSAPGRQPPIVSPRLPLRSVRPEPVKGRTGYS